MSGIVFPDLLGSLSKAAAFENYQNQSNYLNEDRAAKKAAGAFLPKAMQGDQDAINQVATLHPDTYTRIAPLLNGMDAAKRAKVKETTDWTLSRAVGVMNMPEAERPAAYQAALLEGQKLGYKIDMPPSYDRAVEGRLRQVIAQGMSVKDFYDSQNSGPLAMPPPGGGAMPPAGPDGSVIGRASAASKGIESGGRYDAIGPIANKAGNRAYGAHQVMDFNIGPWTQEVLGQAMTPQQFLANPQAQDAVYKAKMGQYIQKYGSPEAASRAWFAGEGGMNNRNATDVLGTSVQGYGQRFAQAYGDGAYGAGQQPTMGTAPQSLVAAGSNPAQMPGGPSGAPPGMAVGDTRPQADASGNALQPPAQAPGAAFGREIDDIRKRLIADGSDIFTDPKTGDIEVRNNSYVVRDRANPKRIVGMIPVKPAADADTGPFGNSTEGRGLNILVKAGRLTLEQAADLAAGKTITDPKTGQIMFATPRGLMALGPDGQVTPVAPSGGPAQQPAMGTGQAAQPSPAGATQPGAGPRPGMIPLTPQKEEPMTEWKAKALDFAKRMATANTLMDDFAIQGTSKSGRFLEALPGGVGNLLQTPEYQQFEQAKANFLNAKLRDESGALIGADEFIKGDKQYFPQPGQATNTKLLAQMSENRRQVVESMMVKAGVLKPNERYDTPVKALDPAEKGRYIFDAKKAISDGRDPNIIKERLKKLGVDPAELDAK